MPTLPAHATFYVGPALMLLLLLGWFGIERVELTVEAARTDSALIVLTVEVAVAYIIMLCSRAAPHDRTSSRKQLNEIGSRPPAVRYRWWCEHDVLDRKRTKHCHECGVCINEFDHHCAFLDLCVGLANYGRFILLVASLVAYSATVLTLRVISLAKPACCGYVHRSLAIAHALLAAGAFSAISFLFLFHCCLISTRQTTYEVITSMRRSAEARRHAAEARDRERAMGDAASRRDSNRSCVAGLAEESEREEKEDEEGAPPDLFEQRRLKRHSRQDGSSFGDDVSSGTPSASLRRSFKHLGGLVVLPNDELVHQSERISGRFSRSSRGGSSTMSTSARAMV